LKKLGSNEFKIILTQGLNRQIRRMCEYLEYNVVALKRTRIMNIELDLPVGKHRDLTSKELKNLNNLIEDSSKTEEASEEKKEMTERKIQPKSRRRISKKN